MIDEHTKKKLLKELAKSGNVYLSCLKTGVDRSTYYRWKNDDKAFRKLAIGAERNGRQNNCDIAEHAVMLLIKDKDLNASKYYLSHNSPFYKPKRNSTVVIEHKTTKEKVAPEVTLEDVLNEWDRRAEEDEIEKKKADREKQLQDWENALPLKPNGEPIWPWEKNEYKEYIKEWRTKRDVEFPDGPPPLTGSSDSES